MDGEDILFIAYTSGTGEGKSKAVYRKHAGYILYPKLTYKVCHLHLLVQQDAKLTLNLLNIYTLCTVCVV